MTRVCSALVVTVGVLGCAFPSRADFVLQGGQWAQPGGDGTPITITYSYNNLLDGGLLDPQGVSVPSDYIRLVCEEAFSLWAAAVPLHFVEVEDVGSPVFTANTSQYQALDPSSYGQIRLNHRYINGSDAQNGFQTTKALAYFPNNGGPLAGDVHFDNADPWAIVGTPSEPDILGILIHELGHALGLAHSADPLSTMYSAAPRMMGPGTGWIDSDSLAGVRAIYGVGVGSVTPLPAPGTLAFIATSGLTLARRRRSSPSRSARRAS